MFCLIDSCQNSISADQYRLTVSRAQVSTLWVRVIFWRYSLTSCYFSNDHRLKFNFLKCIWNKTCFMSRTFKMLISNWSRTRKFNRLLHLHAGKAIAFDFSHCHALITLYVQFFIFWLVKIWQVSLCGKFLQRLETCLLIAGAERVLCHLVMF